MAMANMNLICVLLTKLNMNLICVLLTKLWPVQALACGGGDGGGDGGGGDGGATKTIISPKFSNFGYIITTNAH